MKRIAVLWIGLGALAAWGQTPRSLPAPAYGGPPAATARPSPLAQPDSGRSSFQVVREIDDPPTRERWLLERDRNRPALPGRMVLLAGPAAAAGPGQAPGQDSPPVPDSHPSPDPQPGRSASPAPSVPVIRAGDRLVVEEDTAVVEARLAAVALSPAAKGSELNVRLEIGGKVVRARALGPGLAEFAYEIGGRR